MFHPIANFKCQPRHGAVKHNYIGARSPLFRIALVNGASYVGSFGISVLGQWRLCNSCLHIAMLQGNYLSVNWAIVRRSLCWR